MSKLVAAVVTTTLIFTLAPSAHAERTALEKHVDFFDRNGDGRITLSESTSGLRALGFGAVRSGSLALAINAALGVTTGASWTSPLTIHISGIHLGKHGSDTDIYDSQGRFVQSKFNALFARYDENRDGALSEQELHEFFDRNMDPWDAAGSTASRLEFGLLLEIAGDEIVVGGTWWWPWTITVLPRSRLEAFYDGSLFYQIAGEPVPL